MAGERVLDNRYTLLKVRGRGGMGTVWEARDEVLQRRVAVKEVPLAPGDPNARERVLREARVAARLKHPRLVDVYDVVEEGNSICVVQEFVDGPNLADLINEQGPLPPARVAVIGRELLDGLEAMHKGGVIHRDLKPSNVLLDGDRPRLTDYGIALVADDPRLTSTGMVMGSPAYLSPEQALGNDTGPETDLWSLGATLYFAVEGKAPYEGQGGMATAMQVVNQPAPTPTSAGALTGVISGLMRRDPSTRLRGAELRQMLNAAASNPDAATAVMPEPTKPLPPAPAVPRSTERRTTAAPVAPAPRSSGMPWVIAALIAAVVLIAAGIALANNDDGDDRVAGTDTTLAPAETAVTTTTAAEATTTTEADDTDEDEDEERRPRGVPKDWVRHDVGEPGYSVFVPPNWAVRPLGDTRTDFVDPDTGTYLRVDWTDQPGDSPEEAWRQQSEAFAAEKENYKEISIEPTSYKGFDAALWEYTYSEGGGDLHAYNLGFVTDDYGFALNFQAAESRWKADEGMFAQLKAGFEPPGGAQGDEEDD